MGKKILPTTSNRSANKVFMLDFLNYQWLRCNNLKICEQDSDGRAELNFIDLGYLFERCYTYEGVAS